MNKGLSASISLKNMLLYYMHFYVLKLERKLLFSQCIYRCAYVLNMPGSIHIYELDILQGASIPFSKDFSTV